MVKVQIPWATGVIAPSKPDRRDIPYRASRAPRGIFPRRAFTAGRPQKMQLALGSCTAHGTTKVLRDEIWIRTRRVADPSRRFIYFESRAVRGWEQQDSGAILRDVIDVLRKVGAPDEAGDPYVISRFMERPTQQAYDTAARNRTPSFRSISHVDEGKEAILNGHGIVHCWMCYGTTINFADHSGRWVDPPEDEGDVGAHCTSITGYDDDVHCPGYDGEGSWWVDASWEGYGVEHPERAHNDEFKDWPHGWGGHWVPYSWLFDTRFSFDVFSLQAFSLEG